MIIYWENLESSPADYPSASNVLLGIVYGNGAYTGTYRSSSMQTNNIYDSEELLRAIKAVMTDGLNNKINAIEAQKIAAGFGLTPTLAEVASTSYYEQTWSAKILNSNPAIFYGIEDVTALDGGGVVAQTYKVFCEIVLVDSGQTNDCHNRISRYSRALKEIFEAAFAEAISGNRVKVEQVRPVSFKLEIDSDEEIKVGGVSLTITLV